MIPDIAIIIATYAIARLLCEYVFTGDGVHQLRVFVSIIAIAVIAWMTIEVITVAGSLSGLDF